MNYGYYGGVTATYGYRPNSDQIATTAITSSTGTELLTHSRTYEGPDRLKSVVASRNGAVVEGYTWGYDGAGRRKTATISGGERSGDWWDYSYNNRGEVIGGVRRNAAGQVLPGYEFGYSFDAIGNRLESWREAAGPRSVYTANALNQYESRTVPGEVRVEGQAEPGSALVRLQVDGEPGAPFTVGDGRLFSARAPVDNTTAPQYPELKIEAVKPGGGSATDWRQVQSGRQFVAQTPEVFTHDADGNLTSDGRWTYEWDAENRLIGMETQPAAVSAGVPKMRLEFAYDARHRRIRKLVKKNWNETASEYTHHEDRRFLYDEGWNLLAEQVVINQMPPESMTYLWGLDLSGTRQGAGGIGGLLSVTRLANSVPKTYLPCYDGNGNVVRLVSENGSEADTVYEYGPFGEPLRATGPMASVNPFGWSTQYTDQETGLVMYMFRPYSPTTGRWLSRDPIEEEGGENLYGFVLNNPIDHIDLLGLSTTRACGKPELFTIPIGLDNGSVDVQLWKCKWCCGSDGKSKASNVGKEKNFYTVQLVMKLKGKVSLRDELLKKMAYGRGIGAIISEVEAHTDQRFGDFGLRYNAQASFSVNWDGCLEKITGGKAVTFTITGQGYADANIGTKALGWYASAKATAGGTVQGKIYLQDKSVYVQGTGSLNANGNYSLGWKEQNSKGKWFSRSDSGSVSEKWSLFDSKPYLLYTLPSFD